MGRSFANKKRKDGHVPFVPLRKLGSAYLDSDVTELEMIKALEQSQWGMNPSPGYSNGGMDGVMYAKSADH